MTLGEIGCFLSHFNIWKEVRIEKKVFSSFNYSFVCGVGGGEKLRCDLNFRRRHPFRVFLSFKSSTLNGGSSPNQRLGPDVSVLCSVTFYVTGEMNLT